MEELVDDIFSGVGIKKMKAYKSDLSLEDLNKKRQQFWDKKTNPKNLNWTIWNTIHQAIKYDEHRASLLLELYNIHTINGCINNLIDEKGNKYKIPNYCINNPYYERNCVKDYNKEKKNIKVKFYSYGGKHSIELDIESQWTAKKLKEKYKELEKIDKDKKIRFFIYGIEIKDEEYLYQHYLNEEKPIFLIINIILFT
jgi:hypothetical protein